jgi:hypothetical protein
MLADLFGFEFEQLFAGPPEHALSLLRDSSTLCSVRGGINTSGLSAAVVESPVPPSLEDVPPATLALPDPFHRPPARARTESPGGRPALLGEPLVATRPVAAVVEKSLE